MNRFSTPIAQASSAAPVAAARVDTSASPPTGRGLRLDPAVCEQARRSRDRRFDGLFFIAVTSTGIYCRPVCPAPAAKACNVRYFTTAAAAAAAGFRPCLRCRPELAPGADWQRLGHTLVGQALLLIEQGVLDQHGSAVLAARIGVSERHLRRLFQQELGTSPQQVALNRRLLFAKQLLHDTDLSVTQVALAAGFSSQRRFNDAFLKAYAMNPSTLRREAGRGPRHSAQAAIPQAAINLRIPYRPPYDFQSLLAFLRARVVDGLEFVDECSYERVIVPMAGEPPGWFRVTQDRQQHCLHVALHQIRPPHLLSVLQRIRHLFDVDSDSALIARHLARSPDLKPLVRALPGIRVPGALDGFELVMRAVIGQQVSVAAARTLVGRVVRRSGGALAAPFSTRLNLCFPSPEAVLAADWEGCGLTQRRIATLRQVATAIQTGQVSLAAGQPLSEFIRQWCELPGIGPWTAHYLAMRVLHDPDAFPAGDLILRRSLGTELSERALEERSMAWRPWRAYAALLLWQKPEILSL